ncbi:hypothetical protein ST27_21765 [Xanthomonas phaseoli pv. phaseoli]|nr:hypothetical protein ST27_21765 [Xanthomonas phaseoli pv. phaseoli]
MEESSGQLGRLIEHQKLLKALHRTHFWHHIQIHAEAQSRVSCWWFPVDRAQVDAIASGKRNYYVLNFVGELVIVVSGKGFWRSFYANSIGSNAS